MNSCACCLAGMNVPDRSLKALSIDDWCGPALGPIWEFGSPATAVMTPLCVCVFPGPCRHALIDTNLNGTFHLIHAILPHMRERKEGLVINVTSISGKRTISDLAGAGYWCGRIVVMLALACISTALTSLLLPLFEIIVLRPQRFEIRNEFPRRCD